MPTDPPIRLLCTGDLHLGRRPSRLRSGDNEVAVHHVWRRIVDYAIEQRVDALVLTGDVVDADNRFFEAYGALERGLGRLGEAGVPTFAVAGNHDYDVLPRLAQTLDDDHLQLLGLGGTWKEATLDRGGKPALRFVGWSFPARYANGSPLDDLDLVASDLPTIGLVHGDLGVAQSPYAPLATADLLAHPVDAWLLGHIHQPAHRVEGGRCILYPGSPQPLDPGETGPRGPCLVTVDAGGAVDVKPMAMATVEYVTLPVDLDGVKEEGRFQQQVASTVQADLDERCTANDALRRVVYRLRYTGRTPAHRFVDAWHESASSGLEPSSGAARACIDAALLETRVAHDLEQLARRHDPPGVLAALLLDLESGHPGEEAEQLVSLLISDLTGITRARAYAALRDERELDIERSRQLLMRQGMILLDEMLSQQDVQPA